LIAPKARSIGAGERFGLIVDDQFFGVIEALTTLRLGAEPGIGTARAEAAFGARRRQHVTIPQAIANADDQVISPRLVVAKRYQQSGRYCKSFAADSVGRGVKVQPPPHHAGLRATEHEEDHIGYRCHGRRLSGCEEAEDRDDTNDAAADQGRGNPAMTPPLKGARPSPKQRNANSQEADGIKKGNDGNKREQHEGTSNRNANNR
jgi:hypothetical protein